MSYETRTASPSPASLVSVLRFDAITGLVTGVMLVAVQAPLSSLMGVPGWLLVAAGLLVLPFAVVMWIAANAPVRHRGLVAAVIIGNVAWAVLSLLVAFVWFTPTTLGLVVILAQALAVEVLAWLEYRGWARLRRQAVPA